MAEYYKHIKDEKLKKLIRVQRIIMWIPLLGSLAAIGMMQFILYKKHPEKIAKFDIALIAIMIGLIGLYLLIKFVFPKLLPPGADALIYITALVLVSYFAAFMGVQDEIKTVYELQEGIIELPPVEDPKDNYKEKAVRKAGLARDLELARSLDAARKAEAVRKAEAALSAQAEPAAGNRSITTTGSDKPERAEEDVSVLPPVIEQALVARMIRDDTEKTLRAALPKRTKNIIGHEDRVLRALKVYMTAEREDTLSSVGTAIDFTLLWIVNDERARRAEVLYSRPVLKKGYTCYFSLTIDRGGNKNGMLFKLSEITGSRVFGASHKKYYQTEEIIKTIAEYLE